MPRHQSTRRLAWRGLAVAAAAAAAATWAAGSASAHGGGDPLRVLFIGNSLTSTNDLPGMVAALGARTGHPIAVEMRAPGGFALEDHWNLTDVRDELSRGGFDWVVMQQGPSSLPDSGENLREWSIVFADAIRAGGATPALMTVWPEWYRRSVFDWVIGNYRRRRASRARSWFRPAPPGRHCSPRIRRFRSTDPTDFTRLGSAPMRPRSSSTHV